MKKMLFVTATAIALAATVPNIVAEATAPVDNNTPVADTSDPCSASPEMAWVCQTFFCLCDPECRKTIMH
ncbi:hypothetical protein QA639_34660 [Bradyrhizobium pachyrhizi]|uniref:hypothetical protein n=1 Tax=Bradyrhizobium pachyrhizi TaxID=280333 RepID=UPI0024B12ED1|nr:hypothetical protein [Bradyrhizobium pachyrhizi]WFU54686.1 hypothetical protein QA639_34660 [Bradyrhizobium pachyrhizi]